MVNPSFVKTVVQAIVLVESSGLLLMSIRFNLGCNLFVVLMSRFTTVSNVNKECHRVDSSIMQRDWSLSTDDLFQLMGGCDPNALFSLSAYELSVGKCWWTAEVVDTILVQKGYRITVTYLFLVPFDFRSNSDVFLFLDNTRVLELAGTTSSPVVQSVDLDDLSLNVGQTYSLCCFFPSATSSSSSSPVGSLLC